MYFASKYLLTKLKSWIFILVDHYWISLDHAYSYYLFKYDDHQLITHSTTDDYWL